MRGLHISAKFQPNEFVMLLLIALQQAGCITAVEAARITKETKPGTKLEEWMIQTIEAALQEFQKQYARPKDELKVGEWEGTILVSVLLNSVDLAVPQVILTAEPGPFTWRSRINHLIDLFIQGDTSNYRARGLGSDSSTRSGRGGDIWS